MSLQMGYLLKARLEVVEGVTIRKKKVNSSKQHKDPKAAKHQTLDFE